LRRIQNTQLSGKSCALWLILNINFPNVYNLIVSTVIGSFSISCNNKNQPKHVSFRLHFHVSLARDRGLGYSSKMMFSSCVAPQVLHSSQMDERTVYALEHMSSG
jgi:hypothetical protein